MSDGIREVIEASLFVAGRNMTLEEIAALCQSGNLGFVRKTIDELMREYNQRSSGVEIYEYDGSYGMRVRPELEEQVMHLAPETEIPPAMLKTLALIAYEQPVTQSKLVKERGNRIYRYVKKLREQELIDAKKKGRTKILTVTPKFREYFQIQNVKDLVNAEEKDREDLGKNKVGDHDVAAD